MSLIVTKKLLNIRKALPFLRDPDWKVRGQALGWLRHAERLPPEAIDPLLERLRDENDTIPPVAAWRLYQKYRRLPRKAVDPLLACLRQPDYRLIVPALSALRHRFRRLPRQAIPDLRALTDHARSVVRDLAVWALLLRFERLPAYVAPTVAARLGDQIPEVRLGAALALRDRFASLPSSVIYSLWQSLKTESDRWIRVVVALALVFQRQSDSLLLPVLLDGVTFDEASLREGCATIYGYAGPLPDTNRGRFARLCLPRAFHPGAARDMGSSATVLQNPDLVAQLGELARKKYSRRPSDFSDEREIVQALQSQFTIVAAQSPNFGTPWHSPLLLLDNAIRRVDSTFAYEFRSRFQGFAFRRANTWRHEKIVPGDASIFRHVRDPSLVLDLAQRRELSELVASVLARLDERQRYLIHARFFDELTWREIAETLQLPITTVQSQFDKAKAAIRGLVRDPGGD